MSDRGAVGAPAPPGWYADPWGQASWRWWNGAAWTGYTDRAGGPVPSPPSPRSDREVGVPLRAGGIAALGIVVGLALSFVVSVLVYLAGVDPDGAVMMVASTLGLWTGLVGACVIAVRRRGTGSLRDLGLARLRWFDPLLGIGFAVACLIAVGIVLSVLSGFDPDLLPDGRDDLEGPLRHGGAAGVLAVYAIAVIGAPLVEELYFRGLLQTTFITRWGSAVGVTVTALLFGVVHLSPFEGWGNVGTFAGIVVIGLALGWIRVVSGRLDAGICTHAAYNALVVSFAFL